MTDAMANAPDLVLRYRRRPPISSLVTLLVALASSGCLSFHAVGPNGKMPGEPPKARFLHVEGARVRYVDVGQGPAVVLLHGFASALETWAPLIPELSRRHRVIALDLKGFGWTDRPEGDYSPQAQARLVWALLDARGVGTVAVVAHSWGSSVALAMTLAAPRRVARLALYDAYVYDDQLPTMFRWARVPGLGEALFALFYKQRPDDKLALAFYEPARVSEALVEDVERALERPGTTAAALQAVRGLHLDRLERRYGTIQQPTLLLWGREDRVTPVAVGERLAKKLRRARLVVYPRCGHFPMIEARHASTDELVRFLGAGLAAFPIEPSAPASGGPAPDGSPAGPR
jgi:pimeloyl-ACP methyl ester carboxylesterase